MISKTLSKMICHLSLGLFFLFIPLQAVFAQAVTCHGQLIDPYTQVCWSCMFPITIGSSTIQSGNLPDTSNPGNPICTCGSGILPNVGIATGYWEPAGLVDVTRTPYCMVNMGGVQASPVSTNGEGDVETESPDQNSSFYYVHYYNFPVIQLVAPELLGGSCEPDGVFALIYTSELDPSWNDSAATFVLFPETIAYLNPLTAVTSQSACTADSAQDNSGLPADSTYWCAGSQGFMYPMSGYVGEHVGGVQASVLLSERIAFKLHRTGMIEDSSSTNLCGESYTPVMPKSRYRYQMVYPNVNACEPFGFSTAVWGANQENPLQGDDAGYVIWRKKNCCNYG